MTIARSENFVAVVTSHSVLVLSTQIEARPHRRAKWFTLPAPGPQQQQGQSWYGTPAAAIVGDSVLVVESPVLGVLLCVDLRTMSRSEHAYLACCDGKKVSPGKGAHNFTDYEPRRQLLVDAENHNRFIHCKDSTYYY